MSGAMNPFLANLYKTAENIGASATQPSDDTEKLAQAQVLEKMFASDGVDIGQVPDATILKVASEIFGPNNEIQKLAEHEPGHEGKKDEETDEEKVAKADYLGRVMAHSMVAELAEIEKEAGMGDKLKNLGSHAAGHAKNLGGKLKNLGSHAASKGKELAGKAKEHIKAPSNLTRGGAAAVGAGGAAAGAAAGEAHGRSKHGSAVEMLAQEKVAAILKANGVEAPSGSEEEKLAQAVDGRTREILAEMGYELE